RSAARRTQRRGVSRRARPRRRQARRAAGERSDLMGVELMAARAHPDDESLGCGGTLATCAAAGIETSLVMATRGEAGRCGEHPRGSPGHPGPEALARIREAELRAAAAILGVHDIVFLGYRDQELDRAD